MVKDGDFLSENFAPAVLLIDIKGQQQAEEQEENEQEEKDKVAWEIESSERRDGLEKIVPDRKDESDNAGYQPEEGISERHFLAADQFDDEEENCDGA